MSCSTNGTSSPCKSKGEGKFVGSRPSGWCLTYQQKRR